MLSWRIFYVIERIGDLLNLETWSGCDDIKDGLKLLERELHRMHHYVRNAEDRDEEQLERFSPEISAIANEAEDILEGLSVYKSPTINNRMITTLLEWVYRFCMAKGNRDCNITSLLERINKLLMPFYSAPSYYINTGNSQNHGHQLVTGSVTIHNYPNSKPSVSQVPRRQSYGHVQNRDIVGFHEEIETLLGHLRNQNQQMRVVGIVGMGGCGKTTLAKHLYHHANIKKHFGHRVWVWVSQSWNRRAILYEILRQTQGAPLGQKMVRYWSDAEFADKVHQILSTQTYLVVLDDIWTVHAWREISPAFPPVKGSKVLVTSRNKDLPNSVDPAFFALKPKKLNPKESYELFRRRTFADGDPSFEYTDLGKEMVEKCQGLPLAITALSGILRVKKSPDQWMTINETFKLRILNAEDSATQDVVEKVLALSYHDLPCRLKPCFLYLSIFPENFQIKAAILMRMWISDCLVSQSDSPSEEAERYLEELTQRFLLQDVKRSYMERVKTFRVHDLIREMCADKAKEKFFPHKSHIAAVFVTERYERIPIDILSDSNKFKSLRVLLVEGINYYVSESWAIENLIHMRYLGLRGTRSLLPQSIGNLQNLVTLDLKGSDYGHRKLPKDLWNLKRLKYLFLPDHYEKQPLRLDKLENLQTLWKIIAGDWMLSEMESMSSTLKKLCITDITTQEQLEAVFRCQRDTLANLRTLKLNWVKDNGTTDVKLKNMEAFKQCKKLYKLCLNGTLQESKSIPLVFPPNLVKLEMLQTKVKDTDLMVVLGYSLPYLKILNLRCGSYEGTELTCKAGSFPALERLEFDGIEYLKQWNVERGAMPRLKDLFFVKCTRLHHFPERWRFVSEIGYVWFKSMSDQFERSFDRSMLIMY